MDSVRVDVWLWSVRVLKTRSAANEACRAGHVRVDGRSVKPAHRVTVGQTVTVRAAGRERVLEVVQLPSRRVGPPLAAACFVDRSPAEPGPDLPALAVRDPGTGRPTKRDRRLTDRLRGRSG